MGSDSGDIINISYFFKKDTGMDITALWGWEEIIVGLILKVPLYGGTKMGRNKHWRWIIYWVMKMSPK
jgi:hypothetical protein